jgi:hypothetical protein
VALGCAWRPGFCLGSSLVWASAWPGAGGPHFPSRGAGPGPRPTLLDHNLFPRDIGRGKAIFGLN